MNKVLVPNQIVIVSWNNTSKEHYIKLGYTYTKQFDKFEISAENLSRGSNIKVRVLCDYCGKEKIKAYSSYIREHDEEFGDCCSKCKKIKYEQTSLKKYGVKYPMQKEEINNQRKNTNIKKYGYENPTQNINIKEKILDTCEKKYGGCGMASLELKNKKDETCLLKYGTTIPSSLEYIKNKGIQTCQDRYLVDWYNQTEEGKLNNPMRRQEVREKRLKTLYQNQSVISSKAERETCRLLKEIYGEDNCFPGYPLYNFNMDCMVNLGGIKIDVEYDGWYWHQNKQKDRGRDEIIKSYGYKILRIKGNIEIPTKEQLIEAIGRLVNTSHSFYSFSLLNENIR